MGCCSERPTPPLAFGASVRPATADPARLCSAGAMLFVINHEIIPESHRQGHERRATIGLMLGFVSLMVFDTARA